MDFLYQDIIFIPLVALLVFIFSHLYIDRIIDFLYNKSFGTRKYIIDKMDQMYWNFDKSKMTLIFLYMTFGVSALIFFLMLPQVFTGFILSISFLVLISFLLKRFIDRIWEKRCDRIVAGMLDGMIIMKNGVKSGLSLTQSMERVTRHIKGPLSAEFKAILGKVTLGSPIHEAISEFSDRIKRPEVMIFSTSVLILKETGGNLAETFETIAATIRDRQKVQKKIDALTAQGMMQGLIISCIPFLMFFMFLFISPDFMKPVLMHPVGWFLLLGAVFLVILGSIFMRKIVKIDI